MASLSSRRISASPARTSSTFCYWVKRWRAYLGVTQRRFAELWGVSPSLVQKIEIDEYSVSQLSFERLEALRSLLELSSATFYGLIATHPDSPSEATEGDTVPVRRLEPDELPIQLPRTLLAHASPQQLTAFALSLSDFAPERWRYSLRVGALVVFDSVALPKPGTLCAALITHHGQKQRALYHSEESPLFLHPFDPKSELVLEPEPGALEPLGVVVGHWVTLTPR
jgi:transcriptional regulator with XRE-family HTH domain